MIIILVLSGFSTAALADTRYIKTVEGEFEDVFFDLQDNIINLGLVVERTGDIGQMLDRTAKAVTGTEAGNSATYSYAKYLLFCSSKLTFKSTKADPRNLSICPFIVFAYETKAQPGKVSLGYRNPDLGNLDKGDPLSVEIHGFLKALIDKTIADY
jgi:hypothetical protein